MHRTNTDTIDWPPSFVSAENVQINVKKQGGILMGSFGCVPGKKKKRKEKKQKTGAHHWE